MEDGEPHHDQEISLVAICLDVKPLNDEVINLFKGEDNIEQSKYIAKTIDLDKGKTARNRQSFSTFFSQNYTRYFYKTTRKPNEDMKRQCDIILRAELMSWAEPDPQHDDGLLYISKDEFLQKVGKRI